MEKETDRGTLAGEILFLGRALWLIAAVVADSLYNIGCTLLFFFSRRSQRERMRRVILMGPEAAAAVFFAAFAVAVALLAGACAQTKGPSLEPSSGSFEGQVRQLTWSVQAVADQSDAKKSLESDLEAFGDDRKWLNHLRFDVQELFLMKDGKKSLESDLESFGDPDHEKHGLNETFKLLGW